ncbi:MAG: hydrogenase maturation protease [Candidatus Omnitrophota bacterium]
MKTRIIGIGSILKGDDGIGIRVIDELKKHHLPDSIDLLASDVSGMDLLKYCPDYDKIIVVDAADMGAEPGVVKLFKKQDFVKHDFAGVVSSHGMSLQDTFALADKLSIKADINVAAIQVKTVDFNLELSEELKNRLPEIVEEIKAFIYYIR